MRTLGLLLLAAACAPAANWADRAEYDLVLSVRAEPLPLKRLPLLDQWKGKYPNSQYQQVRRELYFAAYQALGDGAHMLDTAGEMLAAQPDNAFGAYWFTVLLPQAGKVAPAQLAAGEKAARVLLAAAAKPAGTELLAHRSLAWIHWQRSEYPAAGEELRACLKLDPGRAEFAAWLGTVLALEQQPENQVPALWQMARAVGIKGPGALPVEGNRQLRGVLERLYTSYHGEAAGLDQLLAAAAAAPEPPAGFTIESAAAMALRKQDEMLARENPRLGEWVLMRRKLEAPDGDKYFSETLHGNPLARLKGTLIQSTPEEKPTELVIGVTNPAAPEIVLKLSEALPVGAPVGTVIEFEGTIDAFVKSPFSLTALSDRSKISGWPPPPKRR